MHPRLSWDPDIMAVHPLWAGQLDKLNAARSMDGHGGAGRKYIIHVHLMGHPLWKSTHTCKFSHFIIWLAGLRSHMSLWMFSCTVIRTPPPTPLIHIHADVWWGAPLSSAAKRHGWL